MSGIIGLTETGKQIDLFVASLTDRKVARRVLRFIQRFTREARQIHRSIADSHMLLMVLQRYFVCEAGARFGAQPLPLQSLIRRYIGELTRPDFRPTTKTQVALRRKAAAAAAAAASASTA